ncbi:MAG: hypothetical protein RR320_02265 [Oscillospiraceae bacterium]
MQNEQSNSKLQAAHECGPLWFKVQICVSQEREAAERLARRLRADGYHAYVVADDRD